MYNSNNKQYIFKQSSGKIWNFFYDERLGLCYSTLNKRNIWAEPVSLQVNIAPPFFADIDINDCFHILFQDKQGNIFYSYINNGAIKTTPVLNSKSLSTYDKHLLMIPLKNVAHVFFVIRHNNTMIMAHQVLADGAAGAPKVIDYVAGNECPYSVIYDKSDNFYVFYQSSDGKYLQLGYKKYVQAQKFWGEFIPITKYNGNSEYPRVIMDNRNVLHICYQRRSEKQYELIYQQKIPDKNIWTNEQIIHASVYPFIDSSIIYINENIFIFWVREDNIFFSSTSDNGTTWGKPAKYTFTTGKQLMCMSYKTANPYENEKIILNGIPGNFYNGFKLAFYQDYSSNLADLSADELKNMIIDSLKLLKDSIEDLKESYTNIRGETANLNFSQQNLEKEIVKHSIKIGLLENEIKRIKNIYGQFENYKSGTVNDNAVKRMQKKRLVHTDKRKGKKFKRKTWFLNHEPLI